MDFNIVVAFATKDFGIGYQGSLPWKYKEDLQHFKNITDGHVIVMGKNTWNSLNNTKLKNRINIVVSKSMFLRQEQEQYPDHVVSDVSAMIKCVAMNYPSKQIFIIGGSQLYSECMQFVNKMYVTHVNVASNPNYKADTFFPTSEMDIFEIEHAEKSREQPDLTFVTYIKSQKHICHQEYQYLSLLRHVAERDVRPDRTQTGTASAFGTRLEFDISNNIPLLTTKFVSWKTVVKELLFFLKGQTDTTILESQNVNIWKGNTSREFLDSRGLTDYKVGDMGPMYGWVWRNIGCEYSGCDGDYKGKGVDQLQQLIRGLKDDPYSRRHIITTYCPLYTDLGVLPPCHGICVQFYVENNNGLSCQVYIRSNDMFLGQPYNIASYSMMTYIIAKMIGRKPARLIICVGDGHIYTTHFQQVWQQNERTPLPFPIFNVSDTVVNKTFDELELDDFDILGYISHPAIKAPLAI